MPIGNKAVALHRRWTAACQILRLRRLCFLLRVSSGLWFRGDVDDGGAAEVDMLRIFRFRGWFRSDNCACWLMKTPRGELGGGHVAQSMD